MVMVTVNQPVKVNVKKLIIYAKVKDTAHYTLVDENDNELVQRQEYVPMFMPGDSSDHIELEIDINTGQILNWEIPNADDLTKFIEG